MPAISLRQPWATAVLFFGKDVENRSKWHFKHRGPLIIHASKSLPYRDDIESFVKRAREDGAEQGLELFADGRTLLTSLSAESLRSLIWQKSLARTRKSPMTIPLGRVLGQSMDPTIGSISRTYKG